MVSGTFHCPKACTWAAFKVCKMFHWTYANVARLLDAFKRYKIYFLKLFICFLFMKQIWQLKALYIQHREARRQLFIYKSAKKNKQNLHLNLAIALTRTFPQVPNLIKRSHIIHLSVFVNCVLWIILALRFRIHTRTRTPKKQNCIYSYTHTHTSSDVLLLK